MAKTGHPNFDYTCAAYWRGAPHNFSITGNHSGTSFSGSAAQAFMEGTTSPYALCFAHFQATAITVVQSRYYDGQNSAPVYEATYNTDNPAPSPLTALGDAYTGDSGPDYLPLEVCAMIEAQCGMSSTSKPIYLRKFLRGVPLNGVEGGSHDETVLNLSSTGTAAAASLGNGTMYGGRVYISPTAKQAVGTWAAQTYPYNHQIPRGRKRKTTTTSNSVLNTAIELARDAAAAAAGAASGL